jgi:PAS domain S-box-containing protein
MALLSAGCPGGPAQAQEVNAPAKLPLAEGTDLRFVRLSSGDESWPAGVICLVQDDQGFLWLGTEDGLRRYDGYRLRAYRNDPHDPNSLSGSYVYALFKDRSGKLWVGSDHFLDRYDPVTDRFTHYPPDPARLAGSVFHIREDRSGMIWLATDHGLNHLNPTTGETVRYRHKADNPASLSSDLVRCTLEDRNGTLWVATTEALEVLDRRTGAVTRRIPLHLKERSIISLLEDHRGTLWITSVNGLAAVNGQQGKLVYWPLAGSGPEGASAAVFGIHEDADGEIWLGTSGRGLYKLDRDRRRCVRYRNRPGDPNSLSHDVVYSLLEDREGNVWAGTGGGGVNRFTRKPLPFRNYRHEPGNGQSLDKDWVHTVYLDSRGILWVANVSVLNRIDRVTGEFTFYRTAGGPGNLSDPSVLSIVEDRGGNLWFGTRAGGLNRLDRQTGRFKVYAPNRKDPGTLSSNTVHCLHVDRRGTLWAATDAGLCAFDPEKDCFRAYKVDGETLTLYSGIAEDPQGGLWLGTVDVGVRRFDPRTGQFTRYRHTPQTPGGLGSDLVQAVWVDRSGVVWLGTQRGLVRFDPADGTFTPFTEREGLCNNVVNGILEDSRGDLWLSTLNGLSRFNPRGRTFKNYYVSDGLAGNEFVGVAHKGTGGEMFFGSSGGLTSFFPDQVVDNSYLPPVVLTDFQLFGNPVAVGGDSPLQQAISFTPALTLDYGQNTLSFEFAALSFASPQRNRYRHRLEGLEGRWIETDCHHRFVSYTTLAPGEYVFRVQGSNNRGVWNEEGASVRIRILPPWWNTWWFQTGCAAVILLMAGSGYYLRVRGITRHNRELARQVDERTQDLRAQVAERRQAEEALRLANARLEQERHLLQTLMDNLPDNMYFKDAASRFVRINNALTAYFGLGDPAQALGKTDFDFYTEEHARYALADEQAILQSGQPLVGKEEKETWLDGRVRWVSTTKMPLRDKDGTIVGTFGVSHDITNLKLAEEALRQTHRELERKVEERTAELRESEARLEEAQRIAHVGYWERDLDADHVTWSDEAYRIFGLRPRERSLTLGRVAELIHPDDRPSMLEAVAEALRGGARYDVEYRVIRPNGEIRIIHSQGGITRDNSGHPRRMFGTVQDITERRAKEAAEAANRAKDEFLANVSHEIRTPMNAILGMTELALDTPLTDDQRQCLRTVKSAADNLLGIINDLLDFSKIEAGKMELVPADFSLRAAVGDTLRALAARAHKKGIELIHRVQPDVPDALLGDSGRLRQVLLNLVGNAIKFTDAGEVEVRVEVSVEVAADLAPLTPTPLPGGQRGVSLVPFSPGGERGRGEGEVGLRFAVRDTGIGIPKDQQERIFRAFEQEDTSTTRRYGGTGLGLTIAARLVGLMGGTITVDSEPGRGSTFAFTARFGRQPHPAEPVPLQPPVLLHNLPVLVVDDNATNRHILAEWLRGWQMQPAAVGDGGAALDALLQAAARGRPYPLVLLDARMPDVDGLALAGQVRQHPELSATRIILLTSGDRPGDPVRARELRIDAHLLKPVQQDELLQTIYQVMSRGNGDFPPAARPAEAWEQTTAAVPAARPLRILVAEDNDFNAQLLEQLLGRHGHRVRLANNGREALSLATEGAFDLLLLDVHMPELDGFQVAQAVRQGERTAGGHLPIIALTARSRKEDRERCLAAGMDDFLAKPVQAADLWAAVDRVVAARAAGDRPTPGLLDPQVLLAACGGDAAILEKIGRAFRARLPDHLKAIQDALRDRDAPRLREAAHKLSGMVAAFSTAAGGVASDLEDRAAQGQLEEVQPLAARLETMAGELMELVSGLSLEALHDQVGSAAEPGRTASP